MFDKEKKDILSQLIIASLEGIITASEKQYLNDLLDSDNQALLYYLEFIDLHTSIQKVVDVPGVPDSAEIMSDVVSEYYESQARKEAASQNVTDHKPAIVYYRKKVSFSVFSRVIGAIAAMIAVVFILNMVVKVVNQPSLPSYYVATLTDTVDVKWASGFTGSSLLRPGDYYLEQGYAELTFTDDTRAIIQSPAEFSLDKKNSINLHRGRISAVIGDIKGFTVNLRNARIVDVGTEFGVAVDESGNNDVYVFDGEVLLFPTVSPGQYSKQQKIEVYQGQAYRIDEHRQIKSIEMDETAFVRQNEFDIISRAYRGSDYHRWLAYSYQLRRDRDLVAYYTFEYDNNSPALLSNKAVVTQGRFDGKLQNINDDVLPQWVTGRFPEKTALAFEREKMHRVIVERDKDLAIVGPITIAAWIGPYASGNVLSHRIPGGHCNYRMVSYQNSLEFMRIDVKRNFDYVVRVSADAQIVDQWRLLVITHDNNQVKFYYDGQFIGSEEYRFIPESVNAVLYIGSDGMNVKPYYFNGEIDEIAIFKRVLEQQEIEYMYQMGKP